MICANQSRQNHKPHLQAAKYGNKAIALKTFRHLNFDPYASAIGLQVARVAGVVSLFSAPYSIYNRLFLLINPCQSRAAVVYTQQGSNGIAYRFKPTAHSCTQDLYFSFKSLFKIVFIGPLHLPQETPVLEVSHLPDIFL